MIGRGVTQESHMNDRLWREAAERFLAACFRGAPPHVIQRLGAEMSLVHWCEPARPPVKQKPILKVIA